MNSLPEPAEMTKRTRLRRSSMSGPGIRRNRRGRGFSYLAEDGTRLADQEILDRIHDLVIPPAWRKVWICPYPNGHIQAVGIDAAGRRQYLYHEQWRRNRDEEKHDRVLALAQKLPSWRAEVEANLAEKGLGKRRVLAAALRMLDLGIFRTGGEEYAEENGTHGVATLLRKHAQVKGSTALFSYPAKGGIHRAISITDPALAAVLKALLCSKSQGKRLLRYRVGKVWHDVHADDINERFKELAGEDCTAKDLRTWNATVLAAAAFANKETGVSQRKKTQNEAAVIKEVAEALGNTPAVCRRSYVDPRVIRAYEQDVTIASAIKRARRLGEEESRAVVEKATIRLLRRKIP